MSDIKLGAKQLQDLKPLFQSDDPKLLLEKEGITESEINKDPKYLQNRRNLELIQSVTGRDPYEIHKNFDNYKAIVSQQILGKPSENDEQFNTGINQWVNGQYADLEQRENITQMAFDNMSGAGKSLTEFLDSLNVDDKKREELSSFYGETQLSIAQRYAPVIEIAHSVVNDLKNDANGEGDAKSKTELIEQILNLPEDKQDLAIEAITMVSGQNAGEIENRSKTLQSLVRGVEQYGADSFRGLGEANILKKIRSLESDKPYVIDDLSSISGEIGGYVTNPQREATKEEREQLLKGAKNAYKAMGFKQKLIEAQAKVAEIKGGNAFHQGILDAANSAPYSISSMLPYGLGNIPNAMAFKGANSRKLREKLGDDYDPVAYDSVNMTAAIGQTSVQFLQDRLAFKGMGKFKAKLTPKNFAQELIKRAGANIGTEFIEENAQELMLPLAQELISHISKDVKDPRWKDYAKEIFNLDTQKRIFWASLPLSIAGAGVSTATDQVTAKRFSRELNSDHDLQLQGLTLEEAQEVKSQETDLNKLLKLRELTSKKDEDTRLKLHKDYSESAQAKEVSKIQEHVAKIEEERKEFQPTIYTNPEGEGFIFEHPIIGKETYKTAAEAQERLDSVISDEVEINRQSWLKTANFFQTNSEKAGSKTELDIQDDTENSLESDVINGITSREDATKRARIYMTEQGIDASTYKDSEIDLNEFGIPGRTQFFRTEKKSIISLFKGVDSAVVAEEYTESHYKQFMDVERTKRGLEAMGIEIIEGDVLEAFSNYALARINGKKPIGKMDSYIQRAIQFVIQRLAHIGSLTKQLNQIEEKGELDQYLEFHVGKLTGMDDTELINEFGETAKREIAQDIIDPNREKSLAKRTKELFLESPIGDFLSEYKLKPKSAMSKQELEALGGEYDVEFGKLPPYVNKLMYSANGVKMDQITQVAFDQNIISDPNDSDAFLEAIHSGLKGARDIAEQENPSIDSIANDLSTSYSIQLIQLSEKPYLEKGTSLRNKILSDIGAVEREGGELRADIVNSYTGWDIQVGKKGISHLINQNRKKRHIFPHLKELLQDAVWLGRQKHRDADKPRGIRWQHLMYTPTNRGIVKFLINETYQGDKVYDASYVETKMLDDLTTKGTKESRTHIGSSSKIRLHNFQKAVKNAYPDDDTLLSKPLNNRREIKSADPVTYDENGEVIPLSERFNEERPEISYAVKSNERADQLLSDIRDRFAINTPDQKTTYLDTILKRVAKVRNEYRVQYGKRRMSNDARTQKAMGELQAIYASLPHEVRSKSFMLPSYNKRLKIPERVSAFQLLSQAKSDEEREVILSKTLNLMEDKLRKYLSKEYRTGVRDYLKKSEFKKSDSQTVTAKIDAEADDILTIVKDALALDPDDLPAKLERLEESRDSSEGLEHIDASTQLTIYQLFGDFENANVEQLQQAFLFIRENYKEGRGKLMEWMNERKAERELRIQNLKITLGKPDGVTTAELNRAGSIKGALIDGENSLLNWVYSGWQNIQRLGEVTNDFSMADEIEKDIVQAQGDMQDRNRFFDQELEVALKEISGAKNDYELDKWLYEKDVRKDDTIVSKMEGRDIEPSTLSLDQVDLVLNEGKRVVTRQVGGKKVEITLSEMDVEEIQRAYERFSELPNDTQKARRVLKWFKVTASGKREQQNLSQMEGLYFYLLMQSEDSRVKLARSGYDETTRAELMEFLDSDVIELGDFMLEYNRRKGIEIDQLHRKTKNIGIGLIDNYFTAHYEQSLASEQSDVKLEQGNQAGNSLRSQGALKRRQSHSNAPIQLNALNVFRGHSKNMNHWLSHIETADKWGTVIKNKDVNNIIKAQLGDGYQKQLIGDWTNFENAGVKQATRTLEVEGLMRKLFNNQSIAILGGRLSTIMLNASALMNATGEIGTVGMLKGLAGVMKNPDTLDKVWNSPTLKRYRDQGASFVVQQVKATSETQSSQNLKFLDKAEFKRLSRLAQKGMLPISYVDALSNTLTLSLAYNNAYEQMKSQGEDVATEFAEAEIQKLLMRTAQPTTDFSLSGTEMKFKSNVFAAIFVRFMSETRKNFALNLEAFRKATTGKGRGTKARAYERLAYTWVAYTVVAEVMRAGYEELFKDDEEDRGFSKMKDPKFWTYKLTAGNLASIPFLGQGIDAIASQLTDQKFYNTNPNPLIGLTNIAPDIAKSTDKERPIGERMDYMIDILQESVGFAFPVVSQGANVVEAVKGFTENTLDIQMSDQDRIRNVVSDYKRFKKKIDDEAKEAEGVTKLSELKNKSKHSIERNKLLKDFLELETESYSKELKNQIKEALKK